jgi:hypothetical protein
VQADHGPPSRRHAKLEPGSSDENSNVGEASALGFDGATSIVVTGGTVSIVQACVAGVASTFPAASIARTEKVCPPSPRPA